MLTLSFILAAFVAGVLMFLAPCTLPLVPGYLAFISGIPGELLQTAEGRRRFRGVLFKNALYFVFGFSFIFIIFGLFAVELGKFLGVYRGLLVQVGGAFIILFGLMLLQVLRIPDFLHERRIALPNFLSPGKPSSSFFIGALFAFGWSPCVGPILGSILLLAAGSATALEGAFLLTVFSLGLGLPLLLVALLFGEASAFLARAGKILAVLSYAGGAFLVFLGTLMLLGKMSLLVSYGFDLFDFLNYDTLLNYL